MSALSQPADAIESPFGEGLLRRRSAGHEWHLRPCEAAEFLGLDGLRIREWVSRGVAMIVKHGPHRTVYRLALPSGVCYLKHYRIAGPRAWFQNNLRPCRGYREAAANALLRAAGVPTAELLAAGRRRFGPFSGDSYFLTREIVGAVPLDELIAGGAIPRGLRRPLIDGVARLAASLHRHGLYHADFHAGNILVRIEDLRLWLIDLHPLRRASMTDRRRWSMLGMLAASLAPRTSRADRRRFLASYAIALGIADDPRMVETFCGTEVRRRQHRADRKWQRGNRRILILDEGGVACRGVAEVGRELLLRWKESLLRGGSLGSGAGLRSPHVRTVSPSQARAAWETGHALLRRGFPVARPLMFLAGRLTGHVVSEPVSGTVSLIERLHSCSQRPHELAGSAVRLLDRLHDAGFDAPPEAFGVTAEGRLVLDRAELVSQRDLSGRGRRNSFARLIAALPTELQGIERSACGWMRTARRRDPSPRSAPSILPRFRRAAALILLAVAALISGCRTIEKPPPVVALPAKHTVRADHLLLVSDFKLPKDDPLVADLIQLREHVVSTLKLPEPRQDVTVYLFADEDAYRRYLDDAHPGLPPRRAYFVGTKNELAVYTYWGDRVQEDLRHEYTHGILHSSLAAVPLWLDEGLAEYFEVPGNTPGGMNGDYPHQLAVAVSNGWQPDIERLESLEEFSQMRRIDYQESWGWVHYLLHASPDTQMALLAYLQDLRDASHPPALAERVAAIQPGYPARFLGYVAALNSTGGAVIRAASAEL